MDLIKIDGRPGAIDGHPGVIEDLAPLSDGHPCAIDGHPGVIDGTMSAIIAAILAC